MKIRLEKLPQNALDHEMIWGGIGLLALLVARFVPFSLFPKLPCIFHGVTGYPGPLCGMTRSFIFMSHLKFWSSVKMNPLGASLFIFTTVFVLYAFMIIAFRTRRIRIKIAEKWESKFIRIASVIVVLINWIYLIIYNS